MKINSLSERIESALRHRRASNRLRSRETFRVVDPTHVEIDGRTLINFAGNDYLGFAHHQQLQLAQFPKLPSQVGSSASALVTGYTAAHSAAEKKIAQWKRSESAVLLPSGYQANHAAVQTFAALGKQSSSGVQFFVDKLAHASLIDAIGGSGCPFRVYPHNRYEKLERLLAASSPEVLTVVVTESIFSMDGDAVDLRRLAALKARFPFALLLDEAHGSGVYGPGGAGFAAEQNLSAIVDVSICTFSKAAGLVGAAVCATQKFCEALVNFGRAYIYSTAVPPSLAMQIDRSIELMAREPWRQEKVRQNARAVRLKLTELGWNIPAGDSPIIPVIIGDESGAMAIAERLRTAGILCVPIRPPTVPPGKSRLRITVSSEHSRDQIDQLLKCLGLTKAGEHQRMSTNDRDARVKKGAC